MKSYFQPHHVTWKPENKQCKLKYFSRKDACEILADKASTIVFIGEFQATKLILKVRKITLEQRPGTLL